MWTCIAVGTGLAMALAILIFKGPGWWREFWKEVDKTEEEWREKD